MTTIVLVLGAMVAFYLALTESDRRIRVVCLAVGLILVAAAIGAFR
jgi:hypothetical protein